MVRRLLGKAHLLDAARDVVAAGRLGARRLHWARRRGFGRVDRELVAAYLRNESPRRLHLGAGNHELPGWLNSDYYPASERSLHLDARVRFPFEDGAFAFIFSEHMIEHLSYIDGLEMLRECHRVLEPGGVVRVSTPDLAVVLDVYGERTGPLQDAWMDWHLEWIRRNRPSAAPYRDMIFVLNNIVRDWGHLFIYDAATLRSALERAGFVEIRPRSSCESNHEELRGLENEVRAPAGLVALESMTFEATKP